MYALRGITLQCNTQRVWICAIVVMTRAREGYNSIPITLVGTVLQRNFVSGQWSYAVHDWRRDTANWFRGSTIAHQL